MYDHEDQRWKTCPICGKGFLLAPEHALTDYCGNPVCSPHCNNVAYNRKYGDKKQKQERTYEQESARKKAYYRRRMLYVKPVVVVRKDNGEVMKRYPSVKEAAEATGFSAARVSQVCRGEYPTRGDYTFRFDNEQEQQHSDSVVWKRKPAKKAVLQFNLLGEFIARYDSVKEAAKAIGCSESCVSSCCRHRQEMTKGFTFVFASEFDEFDGGKK